MRCEHARGRVLVALVCALYLKLPRGLSRAMRYAASVWLQGVA